jgi:RNA polymerase sigma factor (sigma-70 family)
VVQAGEENNKEETGMNGIGYSGIGCRALGRTTYDVGTSALSYLEYEEVGKQQVYLTIDMEIELVTEYKDTREELHKYVLTHKVCRDWFVSRYTELMGTKRSVAKLSREFNPREKGESERVERWLITHMNSYFVNKDSTEGTWDWERMFFELRISDGCYATMIKLIPSTDTLAKLQERLREIEDTLLRSMLMAGHEIALRATSNILSIDEKDATQETMIFLLESIRRYNPDYRTPQGQRVKLCTYAYGRASRLLKEWILTTSRLVRVPRSKMERILIIVRAYNSMLEHEANLEYITEEANMLLKPGAKPFTLEEADDLIKILTSSYIHLDQPYNRHNKSNPTTIGEMLSKTEATAEDNANDNHNRDKLFEIMEEVLNKTERQIIMLRWFYDPFNKVPRPLVEVRDLLVSVYDGKEYSRESIRQIEAKALTKLRNIKGVQDLWTH